MGPTVSTEERKKKGLLWAILKYGDLHADPTLSRMYKMAWFRQTTNYNDIFSNRQTVIVFFRNAEVVMTWIQLTQQGKEAKKKRSRAKLLPDWKLRQLSDARKQ